MAPRTLKWSPLLALSAALALLSLAPGCGGTAATLSSQDEGLVVVRRSESGDLKSIDPQIAGDVISSLNCGMCYDTLLQYDYIKRPAELVPNVTTGMPTYSEDSLTVTFKLRDDVFFQDNRCFHPDATGKTYRDEGMGAQADKGPGRKLVASDFVYSFKRLAALPDSNGFWVLEGMVEGLDEFRSQSFKLLDTGPADDPGKPWRDHLRTAAVSGLQATDDHTFVVKLTQKYPQFLYAITLSYGAAVPYEAAEYYRRDFFRMPCGSGPYILKSWKPNWEIVWERNPKFRVEHFPTSNAPEHARFKPLMGKRLPIADIIDTRFIKESQPRYLKFLAGELDSSGIDKDQFSAAVTPQTEVTPALAAKGIYLKTWEDPTLDYMTFNLRDPLVGTQGNDPARKKQAERARAIRQAVSMSIDREDYIRRYLNGRGSPALQLVPPGITGYDPKFDMTSQKFNPAAGRKALQAAGYRLEGSGEGPYRALDPDTGQQVSVTICLRSTAASAFDEARFYKASGDRVGVQINAEPLTFAEFLKRQDEGKGQAFDAGWVMDYPDAQNMMQLLWGGNIATGLNHTYYDDPDFNRLYERLRLLEDSVPAEKAEKLQLIEQMYQLLDRDVPWVMINFRKTFALYNPWYIAPEPNEFAYSYGKFWYSDTPRRTEVAATRSETVIWPALLLGLVLTIPSAFMVTRIIKAQA